MAEENKSEKPINEVCIDIGELVEKLFKNFNELESIGLNFLNYRQIVDRMFDIGLIEGSLKFGEAAFKQNPDYEQIKNRLEIIKKKMYRGVERRDEEE